MLKRLLKQKRYFKSIYKEQKGITGLETAIILIAFVVVASVFAYTVLSAGLFSTQKSQEAVYSGLNEAQSSLELKGSVVANAVAQLDSLDYPLGFVAGANATLTRETTTKWEGSGSLKVIEAGTSVQNETIVYHAMKTMDLTAGDTIIFWIKADAALDNNITFALATGTDLQATATETYAINTAGTGWEKHTVTLVGVNDDTAAYFGIYLNGVDTTAGTFYLDNVMFDSVASQFGQDLVLDSCDYVAWVADVDATMTREATEYIEGTGSTKVVIAAGMALNDTIIYRAMRAKAFANGDTITFWLKADAGLTGDMTFAVATTTNLQASATQTSVITTGGSTAWNKYTMTMSGGDDTADAYIGIYLSTDDAGTFYVDNIEINARFNNVDDPMPTYASSATFTVALANGGQTVDFTGTTDADTDGILSDESTKSHKVVVYYVDAFQQVTDLTWTKTVIGKETAVNSILDAGEKFQITVDLTYVNNNAGTFPSHKIGPNHQFTLETKPPTGAVLTLERTMPAKLTAVNNLN